MITQTVAPREMRVLPRGNWVDMSGEIVTPNVPHFLPPNRTFDESNVNEDQNNANDSMHWEKVSKDDKKQRFVFILCEVKA